MRLARIAYLYRWLYYRCYRWSKKVDGKSSLHEANASLYMVAIVLFHVVVLVFLYVSLFRTTYGIPSGLSNWVIGAPIVAIILWHRYFVQGDRHKKIIEEFSRESAEEERRGDLLFGWYLAGLFLSFIAASTLLVLYSMR